MSPHRVVDRSLALEAVRVTEAAALATHPAIGRGDEKAADEAALEAMEETIDTLLIDGTVRVGEEPDARLGVGAKVGQGIGLSVDVALMAIEGRSIIARGGLNALSVMAMAEAGGFLNVPDVYMEKIAAVGVSSDALDLDAGPEANLRAIADAKGRDVADLTVCILDRPRHAQLIAKVRAAGSRIRLIPDGDVSCILATAWRDSGIDVYMGTGGAPQGVLAAAAMACADGAMQARLVLRDDEERARAAALGITDFGRTYGTGDMASGAVTFAATGITSGPVLRGVHRRHGRAVTHSVVMRSTTGTIRVVETEHNPERLGRGLRA